MFEIYSRETREITPKDAGRLLELNIYKSQRNLKKANLTRLTRALNSGEFTTGNLAFAKNNKGVVMLMNGQHQLHAVIRTRKTITAYIEHAKCKEDADVATYYGQFDVQATRSIRDLVRTEIDRLGVDWMMHTGSILAGAISYIDDKGNYRNPNQSLTKHERARRVEDYVKEGNYLNELFVGNESKFIKKRSVAIVILMTYQKYYPTSYEFWTGVKSGVNLGEKDPRLHLRNFLMTSAVASSAAATVTRKASDKEIIVRCVHAWNAYAKGEERTMLSSYHADVPVPKAVKPNGSTTD